jgi:pentatricopeptide repeat protein
VIAVAGRAGDMAHARAQFDRMRGGDSRVVVTTFSYNCLLGGYARNGDWVGAAAVLAELGAAHLRPDSYTFTHLISAAERGGEHEEADDVWTTMIASKMRPNTCARRAGPHATASAM